MKRIRIGNDITLLWSVCLKGGEPYHLEGKDLRLLLSSLAGVTEVTDFAVEANRLTWTFYGKDQRTTGAYTLTLIENQGKEGMLTVDICEPFQLVSRSCMTDDGSACGNVSVESVAVESAIDLTKIQPIIPEIGNNGNWWIEGKDTGKPARGEKGEPFRFEDFTPEQLALLQKPSLDAAKTANAAAQKAETISSAAATAEQQRATAEQQRATAEQQRATAESNRSESEQQRITAEGERAASEQDRVTAEQQRENAEKTRTDAESQRAAAEQDRVTAEQQRALDESQRITAEQGRATAEQGREEAEQQRATAENSRIEAEARRATATATAISNAATATNSANTAAAEAQKQGDYAKGQADVLADNNKKYDTIKQTVDIMEANGNAFTLDIAEGKRVIAEAITEKGVPTKGTDSYRQMADNISQIYKGAYDESFKIEIDDTMPSPEVKRIGSAVFPDWLEGSVRNLMVKDGAVNYELDKTTSYKKFNGLPSVVDGSDGDIMTALPRFWYSIVKTATGMTIAFSPIAQISEGWTESPEIWVGASEGVIEQRGGKNILRSCFNMTPEFRGGSNNAAWDELTKSSLGMPRTNLSHEAFRTACANKGQFPTGDYHQFDYRTYVKLNLMFMCIYGTRNWQADFAGYDTVTGREKRDKDSFKYGGLGRGVSDCGGWWSGFNSTHPFVKTDVSYEYGIRSGIKQYSVNTGTTEEPVVQTVPVPIFLGIANPFGHIFKAMDGITLQALNDGQNDIMRWGLFFDPKRYVSSGLVGADKTVDTPYAYGWIKKMNEYLLPVENSGNESSYWGDHAWQSKTPNNYSVFHGGNASSGGQCGGVSVYSNSGVGYAASNYGSRLCFSPS